MRLKFWVAGLSVFCVAMMIAWPTVLGPIPRGQGRSALRHYLVGAQIYVTILLVTLFITAFLAVMLARAVRKEYREDTAAAMKELIEGTMEDHKRKSGTPIQSD